jgi:hypothetical protein
MRHFPTRGMLLACCFAIATAALAGSAGAAATSAAKGDHWYLGKGSVCINRPGLPGSYARVKVTMHADDFASTAVQAFKLSARLIPTTAGLNVSRSWTTYAQKLTLSGEHTLTMMVYAPVPDTAKDWNLQIHMTWDRMSRVDWHNELTVKNFGGCPTTGGMAVGSG